MDFNPIQVEKQVDGKQRSWCSQDVPDPKMQSFGSTIEAGEFCGSRA